MNPSRTLVIDMDTDTPVPGKHCGMPTRAAAWAQDMNVEAGRFRYVVEGALSYNSRKKATAEKPE